MLETHRQPAETGASARERILDASYELFSRRGIQAVGVNEVTERGPEHPAGGASVWHLEQIRSIVRRLAEEAGLHDTDSFARSWHILMEGSIVVATEGDTRAAQRGKSMARLLIDQYR